MKDPRNLIILVLVGAMAFFIGRSSGDSRALGQATPGGTTDSNNRMISVTGTIGSGVSVLWIIDTVDRQMACYRCQGGKTIELVAARNIEWDLKISQFHDESLMSPDQLKKLYLGGAGRADPGMIEDPEVVPRRPESTEAPEQPGEDN
jgi:hypothetical protein